MFKDIGNTLGQFLEADMSSLQTIDKGLERILVILNLREGLVEEIHPIGRYKC